MLILITVLIYICTVTVVMSVNIGSHLGPNNEKNRDCMYTCIGYLKVQLHLGGKTSAPL